MECLLLHGMSLNATAYPELPCTVRVPDLGGIAAEVAQCPPNANHMREFSLRLEAALKPDFIRPHIVIAHSFGGMLALAWLARSEFAPDGLILVSTTAGPMYDVLRPLVLRWGRREMRAPVAPLMGIWSRPVVLRCLKYVFAGGRECPIDFRTLKGSSDKRIGIAGWQNTSWRQMLGFRRAMHRFDARDSLARITSPTIVLHGDRDSLFPVAVAQNLSRAIVGAELRIVRGAGHILPLSHPEAILSALSDLLGLRAPASSRPS